MWLPKPRQASAHPDSYRYGVMMKTLVVIQARTASSRLPYKVLLPLAGKPLLQRMIQRVTAASGDFEVIVATTDESRDRLISELCQRIGVKCIRGSATDLLDRHYRAAIQEKADVVAKIPSDCPLIDPAVIDQVLNFYHGNSDRYDYVGNLH